MQKVVPYDIEGSKKEQVEQMFDKIAPKYDLLNDLLSFGVENRWKKKFVRSLRSYNPKSILDVATGTGDLIIHLSRLKPLRIVGIDISKRMLEIARRKLQQHSSELDEIVELYQQDSEQLLCKSESFDLVTCAFGVRNFENLDAGIEQMYRVLQKNGILAIMEFSKSRAPVFSKIFNFYFEKFLPYLGGLISRDYKAYKYLPKSVNVFPEPENFVQLVVNKGFSLISMKKLTFGVVTIYIFKK